MIRQLLLASVPLLAIACNSVTASGTGTESSSTGSSNAGSNGSSGSSSRGSVAPSSGSSSAATSTASSTGATTVSGSTSSSAAGSTSTSSGSSRAPSCVANVLDGVPCPAGQTCNQTGTACVGEFAGACSSDADCPCGCSCAGAPENSCTNCLTALGPFFDIPGISGATCESDSVCGPACLGFSCVGDADGGIGGCQGSGLILSPPGEAVECAASPCTDAGVACASVACDGDGDCTAACGAGWTCYVGEDLEGPVLPGHCGVEPSPDAGVPIGDGGFLGAFSGSQITEYESYADGGWQVGFGGGLGSDAYTQLLVAGPDAGTFIAEGFMFSAGCNPVFQIVRRGFAVAPTGLVCALDEQWFAPYVLTFGYAALNGDQLTIETLWAPQVDAGPRQANWSYYSLTRGAP